MRKEYATGRRQIEQSEYQFNRNLDNSRENEQLIDNMNIKTIFIAIATIGLLVGGYVYIFVLNKEHPDFEHLKADYDITAEALYNDFVKDAEGASKKYNGKMIMLSGQVHDIEHVDSLTIAVFIFSEGMFGNEGVRCTFLSSDELINDPSDVINFKIKGFCSGFNDTDVILEKCSLTK